MTTLPSSSSSSSSSSAGRSPDDTRRPLHFCVVCQDSTADHIILPCAPICLCLAHYTSMEASGPLTVCPVCKVPKQSVVKVNGL